MMLRQANMVQARKRKFSRTLRIDFVKTLILESRISCTADSLGIFTLPSISNTKATLQATEIYLTSLFKYNRSNRKDRSRVLVVLEEAHTVVPESGTMGLGDFDSKGMVAKIAQIALQGRKYDVGLLVIAQRTATVRQNGIDAVQHYDFVHQFRQDWLRFPIKCLRRRAHFKDFESATVSRVSFWQGDQQ